jgi:hypothetical protein
MPASSLSLEAPVRRGISVWRRRLFPTVLAAKTRHELAECLERHQHETRLRRDAPVCPAIDDFANGVQRASALRGRRL